jgi:catechol-2,3-dioxygenase
MPEAAAQPAAPRIKGLAHAILYVQDLARSLAWYREVIGMEVVIPPGRLPACFLSFGRRDHDLALWQAGDARPPGHRDFDHLAFEIDGGLEALKAFRARLVERGVRITGTVDHGISYGVYFLDPDGHQLEVFCPRTPGSADAREAFRAVGVKSSPVDLEGLGR